MLRASYKGFNRLTYLLSASQVGILLSTRKFDSLEKLLSAGLSWVSLQLYNNKKLVAAIKHRLGFDLHCLIFSCLTMLLVCHRCQFLKTYSVFLGFLLVLIIYGESMGSCQVMIFLCQLLKIVADHDHVICE